MKKTEGLVNSVFRDLSDQWHVDVNYLGKHQGRFQGLLAVVNAGSKRCVGLFFILGRDFKVPEVVLCLKGELKQVDKGML